MMSDISLEKRLDSIGINVNSKGARYPYTDIEYTLILAAKEISQDRRMLGLLLSWIKVHGDKVNIERLVKLAGKEKPDWFGLLAIFAVANKQNRWRKLISKPSMTLSNGSLEANKSRAKINGEEDWAKGTGYLIPKNSEAIADKFILAPGQLAKVSMHYKNKLLYGANWRADIATAIEAGAKNPFQVAKICHCSYEPAHRVFSDFQTAGLLSQAV